MIDTKRHALAQWLAEKLEPDPEAGVPPDRSRLGLWVSANGYTEWLPAHPLDGFFAAVVVEAMRKRGFTFEVADEGDVLCVWFGNGASARACRLEDAICLAAKKALEARG